MLVRETIRKLSAIVGRERCRTDREDLICYGYDATDLHYSPEAVVFAEDVKEIAAIVRLANETPFYLIPRGAGSGMSGGSLPVRGGVVVALSQMNGILSIDTENLVAVVEPGVVTGHLQAEVANLGLFYPPDPASLGFCTIGGNVAECAGGARALKYGVTKDYVLGLEAVLGTGELVRTGVQTAKGVVGYDLTKLLVGSEGTLAIITKVVLKLLPQPESRRTLMAVFEQLGEAITAVTRIIGSGLLPCALEFMDQRSIRCVEDYLNIGLPRGAGGLLLIEVDGVTEGVTRHAEEIRELCLRERAQRVDTAGSEAEADELWQARRAVSPALFRLNPDKVSEDITVPRNRIPDIVATLEEIGQRQRLGILCFGHAGDGNIHVNIMIDRSDSDEVARTKQAVKEIFEATLELGGTLSGEHGIGITKTPYLGMEIDEIGLDAMRRIKTALDPKGILNPGKIFLDSNERAAVMGKLWKTRR
ncbi:MAG: FAD-binding protein [Deltaproteobacteria bacterium]|nr:MAG: FAD-binding protein [Deltaproteobacteria bacterium]